MAVSKIERSVKTETLTPSDYVTIDSTLATLNTCNLARSGNVMEWYLNVALVSALTNGSNRDIGTFLIDGNPPSYGQMFVGQCTVNNVRKNAQGQITSSGVIRIHNLTGADTPAGTAYQITGTFLI